METEAVSSNQDTGRIREPHEVMQCPVKGLRTESEETEADFEALKRKNWPTL